jgi:UPF0716 protein FxsA
MKWIALLFVLIPAAEISIFLLAGKTIGIVPTLLLIILTGVIGTYFAKHQGLQVVRKVQEQLRSGMIPGEEMLNGVCVLTGGIMLLLPGFITDIAGLFILWPQTRRFFKLILMKWLQKWSDRNTITIIR